MADKVVMVELVGQLVSVAACKQHLTSREFSKHKIKTIKKNLT